MASKNINGVNVIYWDPPNKYLPFPFRRIRYGKRTGNFGDLLGPIIVRRLLDQKLESSVMRLGNKRPRMLAVGSILAMAREGDTIWGPGINGKQKGNSLNFQNLNVAAVRGPLTAEILAERGIEVPNVFGDPAILLPALFPDLIAASSKKNRGITWVPNFHEIGRYPEEENSISPLNTPLETIYSIIRCEGIVSSSLHALIIAEAFNVPSVLVNPVREDLFKYRDYYAGTGRRDFPIAYSLGEAHDMISKRHLVDKPNFDLTGLTDSFPRNLWNYS